MKSYSLPNTDYPPSLGEFLAEVYLNPLGLTAMEPPRQQEFAASALPDLERHSKDILIQGGLGFVDAVGDMFNASPEIFRDPSSLHNKLNSLNSTIASNIKPEQSSCSIFVPSGDPFGDDIEVRELTTPQEVQAFKDLMLRGGVHQLPLRYEPIAPTNNPVLYFLRSTVCHVTQIALLKKIPWIKALGPENANVIAHMMVDLYHAKGDFFTKMVHGLASGVFARYAEPLFHLHHNPFEVMLPSFTSRMRLGFAEFVMEGLLHHINHRFQHGVQHVFQHESLFTTAHARHIPLNLSALSLPIVNQLMIENRPFFHDSTLSLTSRDNYNIAEYCSIYSTDLSALNFLFNSSEFLLLNKDTNDQEENSRDIPASSVSQEQPSSSQKTECSTRPVTMTYVNLGDGTSISRSKPRSSSWSEFFGEIVLDVHPVPGGIHVGVGSINNLFGVNIRIGFQIPDQVTNDFINYLIDGYTKTKYITLYGYPYFIKTTITGVTSKEVGIIVGEVNSKGRPCEREKETIEFDRCTLHGRHRDQIKRKAHELLATKIQKHFKQDTESLATRVRDSLDAKNYFLSWEELRKFAAQYTGQYYQYNPALEVIKNASDYIVSFRLEHSTELELSSLCQEALDPNSPYANYLPDIKSHRANSLFLLTNQKYQTAKTLEELEIVAADFRLVLSIDPTHKNAIKQLAICYLDQGNYQKAIDHVNKEILQAHPTDQFALTIKGIALIYQDKDPLGRELLELILVTDPKNPIIHAVMAESLSKEIDQVIESYNTTHEKKVAARKAPKNAGRSIELLQEERNQAILHLDKLEELVKRHKLHNEVLPSKEEFLLEEAKNKYANGYQHLPEHAQTYFNIQVAQLFTDAFFAIADTAISNFWWKEQRNNRVELTSGGIKLKNILQLTKLPLTSSLQLAAHHAYWNMDIAERIATNMTTESIVGATFNYGRSALLVMQIFRGMLRWFEREGKDRPKEQSEWSHTEIVGKYMDEYALPIGQLVLPIGFMIVNPQNFIASTLSLSPEVLLDIPGARSFLLNPNPRSTFAYHRFVTGNALILLRNHNENFLGSLVQKLGYVTTYIEPLSAGARSLLSFTDFSENAVKNIFNSVTRLEATPKNGLSYTGLGKTASSIAKCFTTLNSIYLAFRAVLMTVSFVEAYKTSDQSWYKQYSVWVQSHFQTRQEQTQEAPDSRSQAEKAMFFKTLKEESRYLIARIIDGDGPQDKHCYELQKTYILSLYLEHFFSDNIEMNYSIENEGDLFNEIACYCEINPSELRRMAIEYEKTHKQELLEKNLITENEFAKHIEKLAEKNTRGTKIEAYVLAKTLNRPIIVLEENKDIRDCIAALVYKLDKSSGEPIFLNLIKKKYTALLMKREHYFERDNAKYLTIRKQQLAPVIIKEPSENKRSIEMEHQHFMDTFHSLECTTSKCQQALFNLSSSNKQIKSLLDEESKLVDKKKQLLTEKIETSSDINQLVHTINIQIDEEINLLKSINKNLTFFSSGPREPIARTYNGVGFIKNTGLSCEEEMKIASIINREFFK